MNIVRRTFRPVLSAQQFSSLSSVLSEPQISLPDAMAEANETNLTCPDGKAPEDTDYANYFCTYAFLYHQVGASVLVGSL